MRVRLVDDPRAENGEDVQVGVTVSVSVLAPWNVGLSNGNVSDDLG